MRKDQTYAPMLAALGTAMRGLADEPRRGTGCG